MELNALLYPQFHKAGTDEFGLKTMLFSYYQAQMKN